MKIIVEFPTVMKIQLKCDVEFAENASLIEIKEKILDKFWQIMASYSSMGVHGSAEDVVLRDEYNVEVTSETELKERIAKSSNFSVVFKEHPLVTKRAQ